MNFGALKSRRSSDAVVHLFLSISVVARSPHVPHTPSHHLSQTGEQQGVGTQNVCLCICDVIWVEGTFQLTIII